MVIDISRDIMFKLLLTFLIFPFSSLANESPIYNKLEVGNYFIYHVSGGVDYNIKVDHQPPIVELPEYYEIYYTEHVTAEVTNTYTGDTCFVIERSKVLKSNKAPIISKKTTFLYSQKPGERFENCGIVIDDMYMFAKPLIDNKIIFEDGSTYENIVTESKIVNFKFDKLNLTNVIHNHGVAIDSNGKIVEYTEYVSPDVGAPIMVITSGAILKLVEWHNLLDNNNE